MTAVRTGSRPLVSVVTVVRDGERTLRRAMESVLGQDYAPLEYIVIDGGSTDGTLDVIREHADRLAFWSSEPDAGIADAFNKGIRRARGEWIGLINADDWLEPGAVAAVVAAGEGAAVVHGWMRIWQEDGRKEIHRPNADLLAREMTLAHPTCFVRRSCYERHGLFDPSLRIAMDYDLMLRLWRAGEAFVEVPRVLANADAGGVSYRSWRHARAEERAVKIRNGVPPVAAWGYFYWQRLRRAVASALRAGGMGRVVDWYRSRWVPSRKTPD